MALGEYKKKRDFKITSEPLPKKAKHQGKPEFVIQEHHARRLHWDLRLEDGGVMKSWAVTREPTLDPKVRRLAVHVEDHPFEYRKFKGEIPKGQYGAGKVEIWDKGTFDNLDRKSITDQIELGKVEFELHGKRLNGKFVLARMNPKDWLLIKKRDEFAREGDLAEVEQGGEEPKSIEFKNVKKVIFKEEKITKADVLDYYLHIAKWMLPYLKDRPVTNLSAKFPDWIAHVDLGDQRFPIINDLTALMYFVNEGALVFEILTAHTVSLTRPDFAVHHAKTAAEAQKLHRKFKNAFVKNAASGFDILAPARVADELPVSIVAPYSLVSQEKPIASAPLNWEELGEKFSMRQMLGRMEKTKDPMAGLIE